MAAGHGSVDVYGSFLAPLLPLFAMKFDLSLTLVGSLASVISVADGLSQPLFGYLGDRIRRPWMALLAPACVAVTTSCFGLATGYWSLVILLIIAGTGRSAYHPQGAASVMRYAGENRGVGMSYFTAAGNLGFATGPLLASSIVALWGLEGTLYAMPIGIAASIWIYFSVFRDTQFRPDTWKPAPLKQIIGELAGQRWTLLRLWVIVVLRSMAYFSLFTFLPFIFAHSGISQMKTGLFIFLFLLGGAIGGIIGGRLSDRMSEKSVIMGSFLGAFPFLQLAMLSTGGWMIVLVMIGGMFLFGSTPVTVALAQRFAPGSLATASSIMLGLGWGVGGVLVTPIGVIADHFGEIQAIRIACLLLLVGAVLAAGLPKFRTETH